MLRSIACRRMPGGKKAREIALGNTEIKEKDSNGDHTTRSVFPLRDPTPTSSKGKGKKLK